MYEALYRKYRPKTFDDVVGQPFITETLKTQVRTGRLSHAYLFIGTRGTGKTTCARILAKAVNCEHPVNGNPCNECAACRGIEDGSILDVTELDAASNNGVDDVRMLRDEAVFSPTSVRKRVYIIDEVHMLSKPAFNALLKILEEPPDHLMFILATTELNKVLPTILSRCQRHSFRRLDSDTIAKRLSYVASQEHINLTEDAAALLGRLADGGMRDGLSLLDQCAAAETVNSEAVLNAMGLAGTYRTQSLADAILAADTESALMQFEGMWQDGKDPAALLGELAGMLRDTMLLRFAPRGARNLLSGAYSEDYLRGIRASSDYVLWMLDTLQKHQAALRTAGSPRLQTELCLVELCGGEITPPQRTASKREAPMPMPDPAKEEPPAAVSQPAYAPPAPAPAGPPKEDPIPAPAEIPVQSEPEPQPMPEPEPEPEPQPTPAEREAEPTGTATWAYVLSQLEKEFPVGTRNVLTDESMCTGEITGDALILRVTDFARSTINTPDKVNKIRQTVSALCGRPMQVRLEDYAAPAPKEPENEKLAQFGAKFGNVTFE